MGTPWPPETRLWIADWSRFQGDIDHDLVLHTELDLAGLIQQSHRGTSPDQTMLPNLTAARDNGHLISIYARAFLDEPIGPQVDLFTIQHDRAIIELGSFDYRVALDFEGKLLNDNWADTSLAAAEYLNLVQQHVGYRPLVYVNQHWAHHLRPDILGQGPVWLAAYYRNVSGYPVPCLWDTQPPVAATPIGPVALWQYTSTRNVQGITANTSDASLPIDPTALLAPTQPEEPMPVVYLTRADIGLTLPHSRTPMANTDRYGIIDHWGGGPGQRWPDTLDGIKARFRGYQDYHMDTRGWSDIAYNFGVAHIGSTGYVLEGRGIGARSGATGNPQDASSHSIVALTSNGEDTFPPAAQAAELHIHTLIANAGYATQPHAGHRTYKSTSCPGDARMAWIASNPQPGPGTIPTPTPTEEEGMFGTVITTPNGLRRLWAMPGGPHGFVYRYTVRLASNPGAVAAHDHHKPLTAGRREEVYNEPDIDYVTTRIHPDYRDAAVFFPTDYVGD